MLRTALADKASERAVESAWRAVEGIHARVGRS
jgi:hypothetical protein